MSYVTIEERLTGVVQISLSRENVHNALNQEMIEQLKDVLYSLQTRKDLRVLQLSGKGRSFCAGADLNWMKDSVHLTKEENEQQALTFGHMLEALSHFPCPTIALTKGAVFGGGVGLTAACDIALTTKDTRFCLSEVKLGLIPALISPLVIEAMGQRQAQKLMLTAEVFNGEQATRWGLTHECLDSAETLEERAEEITQKLLASGPEAQKQVKSLGQFLKKTSAQSNTTEALAKKIAECRATPEAQEGLSAFFEKRPPQWVKEEK